MFNEILLTFDVDWAPDWAIIYTDALLLKYGASSTWFVTHDSPAVKTSIIQNPTIEAGLHPNFLFDSTQGKNIKNIFDNLKKIVPGAVSIRTHGMVYSAALAKELAKEGFLYDSSIYLGGMPGIRPFLTKYAEGWEILRMPYFWSDDGELIKKRPLWGYPDCEGLKILCFHPIHVALNSCCWKDYEEYKKNNRMTPHKGYGARSFLIDILSRGGTFRTLEEVGKEFINCGKKSWN